MDSWRFDRGCHSDGLGCYGHHTGCDNFQSTETSLKFLPPDTQGIAVIDVAALRNTPIAQEAIKEFNLPAGLADFASATGFDPTKDVDKITVGRVGPMDGLVIIQGRIDKFKVDQYFKDKGEQSEAYLGQTIYHAGTGAFLLLDNVVVMGQIECGQESHRPNATSGFFAVAERSHGCHSWT